MKRLVPRLRNFCRRLAGARGGNVAMMFAICIIPIVALLFFTVDLNRAQRVKAAAQSAGDAAVLAALAPVSQFEAPDKDVRDVFEANLRANMGATRDLTVQSFVLKLEESAESVRGEATFAVSFRPIMPGGAFGDVTTVRGRSVGVIGSNVHLDVHFWIDASASMHIAADEAGRDQLQALSASDPQHRNCAFACHLPTHLSTPQYKTSYERARALGIRLRTDVMRDSAEEVVEELSRNNQSHRVRFSISQMNDRALMIESLTSDQNLLAQAFDEMADVNGPYHYRSFTEGSSNFPSTLRDLARTVPNSGRGRNSADARQFVVIVTDGMQFQWSSIPHGPISPGTCNSLKARGVEIAVVHIRYVPMPGQWAYDYYVAPVAHSIGPALQACASPGHYYAADDQDTIEEAFAELTRRLRSSIRLAS